MKIKNHVPFNIGKFRARFNRVYKRTVSDFNSISCLNTKDFEKWQLDILTRQVEFAFKHVPAYKELYKKNGFDIGDLKTIEDFHRLPYVTKDMIKADPTSFLSDISNTTSYHIAHTGGSTDKPMMFYLPNESQYKEQAFYDLYWKQYGYSTGDKTVILRGQKILGLNYKRIYDYNAMYKTYIFDSAFITSREMVENTIQCIKRIGAKCLRAYPSSATLLAKKCLQFELEPPKFDIVILGSENVYPEDIEIIKRVFSANHVLNSYGHSEQVLLACLDESLNCLAFFPQYGYMELADIDSNGLGEIVGTNYSRVMPFIRYRTQDYAVESKHVGEGIFRNCTYISRIEGRLQEFVVTKDERLVSLCNIAGSHMPSLNYLYDMQYYQDTPGELVILAVTDGDKETIEKNIIGDFDRKFEGTMHISVKYVESIPKSNRGKKVMINQKLDISQYKGK